MKASPTQPNPKTSRPQSPQEQNILLDVVSHSVQQAFQAGSVEDAVPGILARLGQAVRASHAFLYENRLVGPDRQPGLELCCEWTDPAAPASPERVRKGSIVYADGLQRWREAFQQGQLISGIDSGLTASERDLFPRGGSFSFALAPVCCRQNCCGVIGLDDTLGPRQWTAAELETLKTVAQILGEARQVKVAVDAEHQERVLAEALRDTAAALNSSLELEDVLDQILINTGRVVPSDGVDIRLLEGGLAKTVRFRGYSDANMAKIVLTRSFPVAEVPNLRRMAETRQPLIIPDTWSDPGWLRFDKTHWIRSYLGAPVLWKGDVIGFLSLASAIPGFFTAFHAERLHAFADQAAVAIENARLFKETQLNAQQRADLLEIERERIGQLTRANTLIAALGHVAARIESASDASGVMETLGIELQRLGVNSFVALREPEHPASLAIRYLSISSKMQPLIERWTKSGLNSFPLTPERFRLFDQIVIQRQPVYISGPDRLIDAILSELNNRHIRQIMHMSGSGPDTKGIYAPLVVEDKVIGLLTVWGENLFETDIPAVSIFASQVAIALDNARLHAETRRLAVTDDLTGLYNRRGLFDAGQKEIDRAHRFNRPLSAIMIDVDHFKVVNDQHGHTVGDQVLQAIAAQCRAAVRDIDIVGRYGGEEFVVILLESDPGAACQVAERLRQQVGEMPLRYGDSDVRVTISLGVAGLDAPITSMAALVERSDLALYAAKQSGRNRVAAYP